MYKVFICEKPVVLATTATDDMLGHGVLMARTDSREVMESIFDALVNREQVTGLVLLHSNLDVLFETFVSLFETVDAAGGVVKNNLGDILLIYRNGKWDLPKGKLESDETIEAAALREVEEECGITGLEITGKLDPTYHVYERDGKWHFKITHWMAMGYRGLEMFVPQKEEGITEVEWIDPRAMGRVYENTYNNVKELLQKVT